MAIYLNSLVITSLLVVFLLSTAVPFTSAELGLLKQTHLHLYFHVILTGPNATMVDAGAGPVDNSTLFGLIGVVDHYLREGPELTSDVIGHAQGFSTGSSQEEIEFWVAVNFVFTEGEFKGSTLAIYGRGVREASTRGWSIIGGSGQFRRARGYAAGKKLAAPADTVFIEFDLFISH